MMKKITFVLLIMMIFVSNSFAYQKGYASWYGGKFQGRQTANGEIFDTYKFTAAHKNLPFNTMVEVINLANGKSTVVRINDRGPFIEGRVLDLSYAAANQIDMINEGIAKVSYKIIDSESTASPEKIDKIFDNKEEDHVKSVTAEVTEQVTTEATQQFAADTVNKAVTKSIVELTPLSYKVQVGSYREKGNSDRIYMRLKKANIEGAVEKGTSSAGGKPIYRVVVNDVSIESLPVIESNLKKAGFNNYLIKKIY